MQLLPGPPVFSRHEKVPGDHLLTADYRALDEAARKRAAADLATFFAELHALDFAVMAEAGAAPIDPFPPADEVLEDAWPFLTPDLRGYAEATMQAFEALGPDPLGVAYGFFDGHGWNLAFDHETQRLNGVYDFADSGFGEVQREFIYPNFVDRDLTVRIARSYQDLTGRQIDMARVDTLTGVLRLGEVAMYGDDPDKGPLAVNGVADWAATVGRHA